ncbi:MAG TPA: (2Fe-2S) ferredoxin domain-containing protein [Gammaproteobacteria bacterium]|nr:(2Fe-2S) ferredoxin domain-containing protein [Gammaproteobacteria bacterium]
MSYYDKHVFFCVNQREPGHNCCGNHRAEELRNYMKKQLKGMKTKRHFRVNLAGCLGRCEEGPVIVIYPDGIWYTYHDERDIDEIIETHLVRGEIVNRLKLIT